MTNDSTVLIIPALTTDYLRAAELDLHQQLRGLGITDRRRYRAFISPRPARPEELRMIACDS